MPFALVSQRSRWPQVGAYLDLGVRVDDFQELGNCLPDCVGVVEILVLGQVTDGFLRVGARGEVTKLVGEFVQRLNAVVPDKLIQRRRAKVLGKALGWVGLMEPVNPPEPTGC